VSYKPSAETDLTLHDYAYLRSWGLTRAECAVRLHKDPELLRRTLKRAALRGDPRSDWAPHTDVCTGTFASLQHQRERAHRGVAA
jgi:hypothetical protein